MLYCNHTMTMIYEREQIALEIQDFIDSINRECKAGAIVVVEGKKDETALRHVGCKGEILIYNNFKGIINLIDHVSRKDKKVILLLDRDKKGKILTSKIIRKLELICSHDSLHYKKWFARMSGGKIMCVENLSKYCCLQ